MTGEIGGHDVCAGPTLLTFFDQVGERLIYERLNLAAFLLVIARTVARVSALTCVANFWRVYGTVDLSFAESKVS